MNDGEKLSGTGGGREIGCDPEVFGEMEGIGKEPDAGSSCTAPALAEGPVDETKSESLLGEAPLAPDPKSESFLDEVLPDCVPKSEGLA